MIERQNDNCSVELSLLKVMSIRDNYDKFVKCLNPKLLSRESVFLLKEFKAYYESYQTLSEIDYGSFKEFFFLTRHANIDEKQAKIYKDLIDKLDKIVIDNSDCIKVLVAFEQQEFYNQLHNDLDRNISAQEVYEKTLAFKEKTNQLQGLQEAQEDEMDLALALTYVDRSKGLKWRLPCLNEHFGGGAIKGDVYLLSGYVDSGKTSFAASQASYWAEQLIDDQYGVWFNTEGNWEQILTRIYQSVLNRPVSRLIEHQEQAIIKYTEKMHGDKNRLQVLNYQGKSIKDVETKITSRPPSFIVFDLLDHINGFDNYLGKEGNSAEKYGHLYQWARVLATLYCPILIISQLNRNGNDNPYPAMTELSGSGEKKQAAASAMIMLGSQEGNDSVRYLSTPKNKVGGGKSWRRQIGFDPIKCQFTDF